MHGKLCHTGCKFTVQPLTEFGFYVWQANGKRCTKGPRTALHCAGMGGVSWKREFRAVTPEEFLENVHACT